MTLGTRNRRCEDCGRSFTWERLNRVAWTWRTDPDFQKTTHLQLCIGCSRKMAEAMRGDEGCTLAFHPI